MCEDVCPLACRMDHISVMERPMPSGGADAAAAVGTTMSGVRGRGGTAVGAEVAFACKSNHTILGTGLERVRLESLLGVVFFWH